MLFRFTLSNTIEGSHVISDPDGWKEMTVKLSRDKEYHSLVEMIEVPLRFYRTNDNVDGGYDYITNVEQTQGLNAIIEILIEVSIDQGTTYETFFQGILELSTIKDISDAESYIVECNIVRNDFWSKFFNRKSQPVDLGSSVSIDGDSLSLISNIEVQLPSQKIRALHRATSSSGIGYTGVVTGNYFWRAFDTITVDEIMEVFTIPNSPLTIANDIPVWILEAKEQGEYTFDIRHECALYTPPSTFAAIGSELAFYFQKNEDTPIAFTQTNFANYSEFTYNATLSFSVGDIVRVYGIFGNDSWEGGGKRLTIFGDALSSSVFLPSPSGNENPTYFNVTADTTYLDTSSEGFLLRDAAEAVLTKIIGRNEVLYSEYLGEDAVDACASNFIIMKGLHVRGYAMIDKPMFMSFDDWWDGANPIFNLGLGYEEIAGTEYIRIEDKGHFYNVTPSLTLNNIDKLTKTYDKNRIFKSIEMGYQKWAAESASGIDDPQTKHTYNTEFKIIGKDEKLLSKFIAASLAIEQTRRNRVEAGKDWRLDEEVLIIALSADSSPYQPETDQDFTSINNLLNSSTRYNIRLTPARNFERWKPYFNGCLQSSVGGFYLFGSGEGNIEMSSDGTGSCDTPELAENQDIVITTSHYTTAKYYEFEKEISFDDYKTIRDNRNNAISVSPTSSGHKLFFIDVLEWDHFNSMGKFTGWIKE